MNHIAEDHKGLPLADLRAPAGRPPADPKSLVAQALGILDYARLNAPLSARIDKGEETQDSIARAQRLLEAATGALIDDDYRPTRETPTAKSCAKCGYVEGVHPEHRAGCLNGLRPADFDTADFDPEDCAEEWKKQEAVLRALGIEPGEAHHLTFMIGWWRGSAAICERPGGLQPLIDASQKTVRALGVTSKPTYGTDVRPTQ